MIGRVATFSQSLYVLNQTLGVQAKMADVQAQTASGLKSSTFGGLGVSAGALTRQQTAPVIDVDRGKRLLATKVGQIELS